MPYRPAPPLNGLQLERGAVHLLLFQLFAARRHLRPPSAPALNALQPQRRFVHLHALRERLEVHDALLAPAVDRLQELRRGALVLDLRPPVGSEAAQRTVRVDTGARADEKRVRKDCVVLLAQQDHRV